MTVHSSNPKSSLSINIHRFFAYYFQPQLVEKALIVDVSPVTTSPALSNMGEIFSAMKRVRFPSNIDLPEARILADKQLKASIPEQVTRSFILMNLYRAPTGM